MNKNKKEKLEQSGWTVGSVDEFLGLSPEESAYIELKLALSKDLKEFRQQKNMTQEQVAKVLKSSQSRVAKMENGDSSVSLDLLFRSLFALGKNISDFSKLFDSSLNLSSR